MIFPVALVVAALAQAGAPRADAAMTRGVLLGAAVLILTQVAIVVSAIVWQRRSQRHENHPSQGRPQHR